MTDILIIALTTMGGLGFIFAGGLAFADKKLRVQENPLIEKINNILPGANCGACGKAGCYDFSLNVVEGKIKVNSCPVGGEETANLIAKIIGVETEPSIKQVPRILCRGGKSSAKEKSIHYIGPKSCSVMKVVADGNKLCDYGCLGGGDCISACQFNALIMNEDNLPEVIEDLCSSCGLCAKACSRNLIEMHPIDRRVFVFCKSHYSPKKSIEVCSAACTGCGICERISDGGVKLNNYLAEIDYNLFYVSNFSFEKCKTKAISYIN